jgi:two-component system cell cycle sensor histidine kinase/response regulator CckA
MKSPDKSKEQLIEELLELRRQVARLKADAVPRDCMTLIDRNYVYKAVDAAFCRAHGKAWEEVVGTSVANVWGADTFETTIKGYLDQCFTGQAVEYEAWFTFGERGKGCYHVFYNPYFNEDGTVAYAAVVSHDVTERKQAEEACQVLVNKAPMGIFIVQDGKFQMVNPGFEKITGYTAQEMIGHDNLKLGSPEYPQLIQENAVQMLKGAPGLTYEFLIITKSGETRWVMGNIASTIYQGKQAMLGYFIDISEHKSLEDQFIQAQKMEEVGTLAGGIAHDFNNILTAILGNIGLAALDDKISPLVKDRLAQAEAACLRAQTLSQQLLTFAKGGKPVKKLFSAVELLTKFTAFTCVGSPVKCETTFPENLWWIEADPRQIDQVFQNLTINAFHAMPTGRPIKIWAENLALGTESDLPLTAGRYIKISVRDQGMAIPAEHLPRIFDPYFTTKQKGSGLGLASAYSIIKNHHGHIAVESKPGVGTTFHIYLPAIKKQATPQPEEDSDLPVGTGKILVMDDEEMVREVLGIMLTRLGYEGEFARDGGEAIAMFVKAHGSGQAFAAVILDLTVPGGMGGKEALAKLLEIDPQVKAVVSSGYSDDPIMADFQKYGFSGVIAKPYRISELGKILHEVVMKK